MVAELRAQSWNCAFRTVDENGETIDEWSALTMWIAGDGNCEAEVWAVDGEEAAEGFVDGGNWNVVDESVHITVEVYRTDADGDRVDRDQHTISLHPMMPECIDGHSHSWEQSHIHGNGGGVVCEETCSRCGLRMTTDTWAANPSNGEPVTSISYDPAEVSS